MAIVILDASVVIAFRNPGDAHHDRAVASLASHAKDTLVLPTSAYAEALVAPYRIGDLEVASLEAFISDLPVRVEPISAEIAHAAARLRARHRSLRLPDALVIATGEVLEAAVVLTADAAWTKISKRARVI